ncbi:MAG: toxin-antitoxin system YwqK family antitoxin [Sphingobacteriales bacterium]
MKRIITAVLFLISGSVYAQKLSDYGYDKVRIVEPDKIVKAEIIPINSRPAVKPDRLYYWYNDNRIHTSQGGYTGKLLNGLYEAYYLNHNLKEQGVFKKGLKDGVWKSWNEDGTLSQTGNWKNGLLIPQGTPSFWDKINILKRKAKSIPADSTDKKH